MTGIQGGIYQRQKSRTLSLNRDIIILDDIISIDGSIVKATEILRRKSSGKIYVMCSHSLINENNIRNILDAGVEDIIATNSIPNRFAKIDISPALASCIRKEFENSLQK